MTPDAKLRMDVYQEGQRAFNASAACPYTDWRAKTWAKGYAAAKEHTRELLTPGPGSPERETEQEWLDGFITRAGFNCGWSNLESWARRMAEQAYRERHSA